MIDYSGLHEWLPSSPLAALSGPLPDIVSRRLHDRRHGKMAEWLSWLEQLPGLQPSSIDLNAAAVRIGVADDIGDEQRAALAGQLRLFHPWRKGPFEIFGIMIDTEWRSDWKWQRLEDKITPLTGRYVLDVGCGSGYHVLRMVGAGARQVIGIDSTMLYVMQFQALCRYLSGVPAAVLPLHSGDLPGGHEGFDTVFSMGVLYHCRSPFDHLYELREQLRSGGELILETLVVDGPSGHVLVPEDRYARMRNVWFIPAVLTLESWLKRSGFRQIRLLDVTATSLDEQRSTDWMTYESLADFLDPHDRTKTREGLPAPLRAIIRATKS